MRSCDFCWEYDVPNFLLVNKVRRFSAGAGGLHWTSTLQHPLPSIMWQCNARSGGQPVGGWGGCQPVGGVGHPVGDSPVGVGQPVGGGGGWSCTTMSMTQTWLRKAVPTSSRSAEKQKAHARTHAILRSDLRSLHSVKLLENVLRFNSSKLHSCDSCVTKPLQYTLTLFRHRVDGFRAVFVGKKVVTSGKTWVAADIFLQVKYKSSCSRRRQVRDKLCSVCVGVVLLGYCLHGCPCLAARCLHPGT